MDRKTIGIGFLSLTAIALFVACLLPKPDSALGNFSIKDRDYQMVTMKTMNGDDALYVIDNRAGKMVVFLYDPMRKRIEPKGGKVLADIFK